MKAKKFAAVASALSVAMLGMTGFANPANAADPCDITGVIYDDCTYTVPTGVTKLSVELAGGGGGGTSVVVAVIQAVVGQLSKG